MRAGMGPKSYEEAVKYIEEIPKFTKKHSLEHTRQFLNILGNPGKKRKIIHVAGTNGKGSVCAYIQAILAAEGKNVGFFTSPHLISVNERIQINRNPIDNTAFYRVFCCAYDAAIQMQEQGMGHPSYFEFLFGMGMCAFEESAVEYLILETGLGGRLDATNAFETPCLSVITSISLDHTGILGDTIEQIAMEKAGIIKDQVPVFFDGTDPIASKVIQTVAKKKNCLCREITKNAFEIKEVCVEHIAFYRGNAYDDCSIWKVPICGLYQVVNAELAIEAMEYLLKEETMQKKKWIDAIFNVKWEGRMEQVSDHFLLDGAHNPGAIQAFLESVDQIFNGGNPVVIFSAVADKEYEKMVECLCKHLDAKAFIVTQIEDERKVESDILLKVFQKYTKKPIFERKLLKDAIALSYEIREGEEIFCLGSLYLVGMVKKYLAEGEEYVKF